MYMYISLLRHLHLLSLLLFHFLSISLTSRTLIFFFDCSVDILSQHCTFQPFYKIIYFHRIIAFLHFSRHFCQYVCIRTNIFSVVLYYIHQYSRNLLIRLYFTNKIPQNIEIVLSASDCIYLCLPI